MKRSFAIGALLSLVTLASGADPLPLPEFTLWGRVTAGQVVSSQVERLDIGDYDFNGEWLKTAEGGIRAERRIGPHTVGRFNGGLGIRYAVRQKNKATASTELTQRKVVPFLLDASLASRFAPGGAPLLIEAGYFPFKYNHQSTSLGEYLFRTGTYPGYVVSGFEQSIDRPKVGGIHVSLLMPSAWAFQQDLLLTTEMDVFPLHDISLTYVTAVRPHSFIDIGGGVQLARIFPADARKSTPGLDDSVRIRKPQWVQYSDDAEADTTLYTFRGTKLMARIALNPQAFFSSSILGKEDLKIYGEAAVLGIDDYAGWYENIEERIPVMAGVNWPTHPLLSWTVIPGVMGYLLEKKKSEKRTRMAEFGAGGIALGVGLWLADWLLNADTRPDIISLEGEWYGSRYYNSQEFIWKGASPVPYTGNPIDPGDPKLSSDDPEELGAWQSLTDDDWRWSLYLSKKVNSFLRISAQMASDHTPRNWYTPGPPSYVKYTEMVPRSQDWYYMFRVSYLF